MDYKNIALGVFQVQNQVRKNPQSIIPKLEEMLRYFQGSLYKKPGEIPLQTNEGPNAVMECIQALKSAPPVCELTLSDGLVKACQDHVNDIGPNGACSHSGSDGSTFTDRIERYGEWMGNIAENCEFGSSNPEEIVINLLVDDGCGNRGHRKNILNPKYKVVGVASGAHKGVRHCTVLDYASEYGPKGQGTWNNPPSAFGNDMGVSFGAKPAYTTNYTQPTNNYTQPSNPTSYTNTFSAPTSNYGYGGNNQGAFGVPMTVSTTYTPSQQQQSQPEPQNQFQHSQSIHYAPSQSQYQPQQQYQPQSQPQPQQQPTSYTSYTSPSSYTTGTAPSSYTTGSAPTSYTAQPTYNAGHGTPSFSQNNNYSTPSYSNPTSNYSGYSNPTPNQSPYTQTTQNVTEGPDGRKQTTTTTTSYSSSNNSWGSDPRDDFGFPQSTFQTKQFGDKDLLKDKFISEHLAKMKLTTDSSSTNLREMAKKEAPPGANGWSINSTIEIRNGQKYTKVVTTYSFPDGRKQDVIKEFMEGGL